MSHPIQDPVEHVVLLMMENRSFFRVFGYMDPMRDTYVNKSAEGKEYQSAPTDDLETPDPPHEIPFVNLSLEGEKPDGFVKAYEKYHKERGDEITDADLKDIMGYTQKGFLPALHRMADFGSVCSQWYCSLRGPTWPNRMYALSGTCFGWRTTPEMNPEILSDLKGFLNEWHGFKPVAPQRFSVFDILDEKKVSYNVYTDTPLQFTLSADVFYPRVHDTDMDEFYDLAKKGTLPKFSFIEPNFVHMPKFGFVQNDDHPPANPLKAQKFIADIYNALRQGPKWKNTLFVVTYDEHGGFFDPVIPPEAPIPDLASNDQAKTFGKFGVRVPTVLVSPCIKQGVDDTVYDHTSVLKYVLQKWAPEAVGWLGERVKHANTLPVMREARSDRFPLITDDDFTLLREHRIEHDKEIEPDGCPAHRLPLHESAQHAIEDAEVEHKLRSLIIAKRVNKCNKDEGILTHVLHEITDTVAAASSAIAHDGLIASAASAVSSGVNAIAHGISHIFHHDHEDHKSPSTTTTTSHSNGKAHASHEHPSNATTTSAAQDAHAPAQYPPPGIVCASPVEDIPELAKVSPAVREEARQYADDMIRLIKEGTHSQTLLITHEHTKSQDLMANQIRAVSMFTEKYQGKNDLARSYLQLMQVRAKKHTKKVHGAREV